MALLDHPTLNLRNLPRTLAARVPHKVLRDRWNRLRFGPSAPLSDECIFVSPLDVRHIYLARRNSAASTFKRRHSGLVIGGDWDQSRSPLPETRATRAIYDRFVRGMSWAETGVLDYHLAIISEKGISEGARTLQEVLARYEALDRVYEEALRTGRLRPRYELPAHFRREHGGIFFHIARDGEPLRSGGGRHRFAIARILGLASVPAQLGVIHPDAVRDGHLERLRSPG
ncbi:hypothetical protein P775_11970 [Puniceibacterium antarcticum]|uniref:Uncharacterized protein n=1 Tax=Puniceibacterium antarcticum TaxID=1206336 RepID=A0A2G8REF3_9RHOB|nr:hypothetical protein [Puniceibacterium antarcticum]PIL19939.1 hypothetical protein P775_11970 [Puniceibacterium antarcticum]